MKGVKPMLRPSHGEAPKICQFDRILGSWDFEGGAFLHIIVGGHVDTTEALDMVEILVRLKREELTRASETRPPSDGIEVIEVGERG